MNSASEDFVQTGKAKPAPTPEAVHARLGRRVKDLRTERKWSLEAMAAASGVSRSMLSQIERDQANPTLAVTLRIARAFGLSLGEMLQLPEASSALAVIRAGDRAYHYRSDKDCQIRTLSPLHLEKDVEFYEVRLGPGGTLSSAPHFEGTREFLTVQAGSVQVSSAGDTEHLEPGDSAHYRADVSHSIANSGRVAAVLFLVVIYK